MAYKNLLFDVEGSVATVTINRPKALNALNAATLDELDDVRAKCEIDDNIRVVIITGAGGKSFVAGADITEFKDKSPREVMLLMDQFHRVFRSLEVMPKPTIAAIQGFCLGGGQELAMSCDVRFASDNSVFGQPETGLGLIPGGGGTQRLPRLVGTGIAKEIIYSARNVTAQRAYEIGLVNKLFPAATLMAEVRKFAEMLAKKPPFALKMAKHAITYGQDMALDDAKVLEIECQSLCWSTSDLTEGVSAFLEKRRPTFTGK